MTATLAISKRMIEPGWAEVVMRVPRPEPDTEDYELDGEPARLRIAQMMLAYTWGMAMASGDTALADAVQAFAAEIDPLLAGAL